MHELSLLLRVVGLARREYPRLHKRCEIDSYISVRTGVVRVVLPHILDLGLDGSREVPGVTGGPKERLGLSRGEEVDQATGVDHRWLG
jgi:hypothetical protein